jgi:hypothetical protein
MQLAEGKADPSAIPKPKSTKPAAKVVPRKADAAD